MDILSPEFAKGVREAARRARREALAGGHAVVYLDPCGCYVQELPDGRKFEVRFLPGMPAESQVERVRELPHSLE